MTLPTFLKNKKVVKALVGLAVALAGVYGYNVSPEFQSGILDVACAIVECEAVAE